MTPSLADQATLLRAYHSRFQCSAPVGGPIDVHCHWCVFDRAPARIESELLMLERAGFSAASMMLLAGFGLPADKVSRLITPFYREATGLLDGRGWRLDDVDSWLQFQSTWTKKSRRLRLIPFIDVRGWDGQTDMTPWFQAGCCGIKNILILDEDESKMDSSSLRHIHGLSKEEYLDCHRRCFELAERCDVPMVYHADLSFHADFVNDCLASYPNVRVNMAHLGLSRRRIAPLLEKYPRVFSDIANLEPHVCGGRDSYISFVTKLADRVLLGSDCVASIGLRPALRYVELVRELALPSQLEEAILWGNARRFLGRTFAQ